MSVLDPFHDYDDGYKHECPECGRVSQYDALCLRCRDAEQFEREGDDDA